MPLLFGWLRQLEDIPLPALVREINRRLGALDSDFRSKRIITADDDGDVSVAGDLAVAGNAAVTGDITAAGGFRQTPDGWYQDNVAASQTDVELTRATGRFRAVRAGSVTGVIATASEARTAGTLTVTVFKNTGLAGATGSTIGLTAVLDATNTSRKATTQAKDTDAFAAGDELYAVVTTDANWLPVTSDLRVALEIED